MRTEKNVRFTYVFSAFLLNFDRVGGRYDSDNDDGGDVVIIDPNKFPISRRKI